MPFGPGIYTSARDIGNFAAGFQAGKAHISPISMRLVFDIYQTYSSRKLSIESKGNRIVESLGWKYGFNFSFGINKGKK